jgi:hypothetical protein
MADREATPELYESAWNIARASSSFEQGWRAFRRANSSYPRDELKPIYDGIYDRSQRVAYMEDSNQGYFISRTRLQCPEGGNALFYTVLVQYADASGNVREHYFHTAVDMQRRIGQTNDSARDDIARQIRDRYRDQFPSVEDAMASITAYEMRQVKCLVGGD